MTASALAPAFRMNPGVKTPGELTRPNLEATRPSEPPATVNVTNDATIAAISLHALMRHQYQRRMYTSPVPAPSPIRNFHACSTVLSCDVTTIERRKSTTVAARDTAT